MKRANLPVVSLVVALVISLPYVLAYVGAGSERMFVGFLLNPIDGATYLAKMTQGWQGAWRFSLPFTAEPGDGAYLFLFYVFLGHLARWTGLSLILTFHLARLVSAGLLLLSLSCLFKRLFAGRSDLYRLATWLSAVGSGMGWLIVFLGPPPTDFWVAEAYPFLSMYTNPHFPFGLAALLWALVLLLDANVSRRNLQLLGLGLVLSIVQPFALVVALLVAVIWKLWAWRETGRLDWKPVICLGAWGGPFLLYQFWVAQTDPVLAGWNAQNLTPAPPLYDFLFSFSPVLILAFFGAFCLMRGTHPARHLLVTWSVLGFVLVFSPMALQRRFLLGYYVPLVALAVYGIDYLRARYPAHSNRLVSAVFALALPTNVLIIVIGLFGALTGSSLLYLTRSEAAGLDWIREETPAKALVLASAEMGRFIPALTGRRVLYGHPFETVNAAMEEQRVQAFFEGQAEGASLGDALPLSTGGKEIDFIFYGPRERALNESLDLSKYSLVFESADVQVYSTQAEP